MFLSIDVHSDVAIYQQIEANARMHGAIHFLANARCHPLFRTIHSLEQLDAKASSLRCRIHASLKAERAFPSTVRSLRAADNHSGSLWLLNLKQRC